MGLYNRFFKRFFAETEFSPDCAVRFTGAGKIYEVVSCFLLLSLKKYIIIYIFLNKQMTSRLKISRRPTPKSPALIRLQTLRATPGTEFLFFFLVLA